MGEYSGTRVGDSVVYTDLPRYLPSFADVSSAETRQR